ncbi:hypothetical protein N9D31_01915 [Oligoflexaceae bacterium]|nr:hypothetical protein [Oligoflexaceae bacterium]
MMKFFSLVLFLTAIASCGDVQDGLGKITEGIISSEGEGQPDMPDLSQTQWEEGQDGSAFNLENGKLLLEVHVSNNDIKKLIGEHQVENITCPEPASAKLDEKLKQIKFTNSESAEPFVCKVLVKMPADYTYSDFYIFDENRVHTNSNGKKFKYDQNIYPSYSIDYLKRLELKSSPGSSSPSSYITEALPGDILTHSYRQKADHTLFRGDFLNYEVIIPLPAGVELLVDSMILSNPDGGEIENLSERNKIHVKADFVRLGQSFNMDFETLITGKAANIDRSKVSALSPQSITFTDADSMEKYSLEKFSSQETIWVPRPSFKMDLNFPRKEVSGEFAHGTHVLVPNKDDQVLIRFWPKHFINHYALSLDSVTKVASLVLPNKSMVFALKVPKGLNIKDAKFSWRGHDLSEENGFEMRKVKGGVEFVIDDKFNWADTYGKISYSGGSYPMNQDKISFDINLTVFADSSAMKMKAMKPALSLKSLKIGSEDVTHEYDYADYEEVSPITFIVQ